MQTAKSNTANFKDAIMQNSKAKLSAITTKLNAIQLVTVPSEFSVMVKDIVSIFS